MIGPSPLNINIYQGASFQLPFQLLDSDDVAVSMAGATIRSKIRNDLDDAAAILTFTGTVTDGPNGEGEITATAAQTAALVAPASEAKKRPITKWLWDLEVEFADATVVRVYEGFVFFSPESTK